MELEDDSESDSYYDSQEEGEEEFSEERINTQSDLGMQSPTKIMCPLDNNDVMSPKSAFDVSMSPTLRE